MLESSLRPLEPEHLGETSSFHTGSGGGPEVKISGGLRQGPFQ